MSNRGNAGLHGLALARRKVGDDRGERLSPGLVCDHPGLACQTGTAGEHRTKTVS